LRRDAFPAERSDAQLRGVARAQRGAPAFWTFYLEAGVSRYLPLLGPFEMLRFRERQNFRFADRLGLVALRDEPVSMTAYRIQGMLLTGAMPDPGLASRLGRSAETGAIANLPMLKLNLIEADRGVLARGVAEITGGGKIGAEEFGVRASAWLAVRHGYSLESRIPAGTGDPLVRWLESRVPGHCELFAGALVLLAREAGLPARVVTGFKGGTWNAFSNNLTLRNSNAHAWCEVFDPATAIWRRVDPTPGAAVPDGPETTQAAVAQAARVDRSWSARLDSLRVFWYRRIVNFDQRTQVETLQAVKTATQETGRRLREGLERAVTRLKTWLLAPWNLERAGRWLALLAALAGTAWLARNFRLTLRRAGLGRREDPVRRAAGRWLVRLRGLHADPVVLAEAGQWRDGLLRVPVRMVSQAGSRQVLHASAEVLLAEALPAVPADAVAPIISAGSNGHHMIYGDGQLFHGPHFQGIESLEACSETEMAALVKSAPAPKQWIQNPLRPGWLADPLALDSSFQMMILWSWEHREAGSLPCAIRSFRQYAAAFPKAGSRVVIQVTDASAPVVTADLHFLDLQGHLLAVAEGYECVMDQGLRGAFRQNCLPHGA
jgi:hypothetical protein